MRRLLRLTILLLLILDVAWVVFIRYPRTGMYTPGRLVINEEYQITQLVFQVLFLAWFLWFLIGYGFSLWRIRSGTVPEHWGWRDFARVSGRRALPYVEGFFLWLALLATSGIVLHDVLHVF